MIHSFSGTVIPSKYVQMVPEVEQGKEIPKIVHHIYFGTIERVEYLDNLQQLRDQNLDYRFVMYDDETAETFINERFGDRILAYFRRISSDYSAAKSDFLRYLVIYAEGGVYLDVKSSFSTPIRDSISGHEGFVLAQWMNQPGQPDEGIGLRRAVGQVPGGEFQQWHVIAWKGHPYLRSVIAGMLYQIDRYRPWVHLTGRIGVLNVTGPILYTNAIYKILNNHKHKLYRSQNDAGLIYSVIGITNNVTDMHYSRQRTPVIKLAPHLRVVFFLYKAIIHVRWRLNGKREIIHPDY